MTKIDLHNAQALLLPPGGARNGIAGFGVTHTEESPCDNGIQMFSFKMAFITESARLRERLPVGLSLSPPFAGCCQFRVLVFYKVLCRLFHSLCPAFCHTQGR